MKYVTSISNRRNATAAEAENKKSLEFGKLITCTIFTPLEVHKLQGIFLNLFEHAESH